MSEWENAASHFTSLFQWSDSELAVHLREFASRYQLPNIVKVTKGQYRNIGVAKSVYSELYLQSIQTTPKVYAEGIKVKEGKRHVGTIEQRYAIPLSYEGWFELLSEDGRAVAPFYSVAELQQAFPPSCLVREATKAYAADEAGQINLNQSCVISVGDQLTLIRNASLPTPGLIGSSKKKYLCCRNLAGETVYLPADQKGLYSPIAGISNISGVHNIKGLLEKLRMPFKVRLVHGVVPGKMDRSFTGCFRFVNVFSDETAFVCPLKKDAKLVPVSLKEPLKVLPVQNFEEVKETEEYKYYEERTTRMTNNYLRSIHLLVAQPDMESVQKGQQELRRSLSASDATTKSRKSSSGVDEDILFSEIDEIYQYVRRGGVPPLPKRRPKSDVGLANNAAHTSAPNSPTTAPGPVSATIAMSPTSVPLPVPATPAEDAATAQHLVQPKAMRSRSIFVSNQNLTVEEPTQHRHSHHEDEHYWEDPVYADISGFRKGSHDRPRSRSKSRSSPDSPVENIADSFEETDGITVQFGAEAGSDSDTNSDRAEAVGPTHSKSLPRQTSQEKYQDTRKDKRLPRLPLSRSPNDKTPASRSPNELIPRSPTENRPVLDSPQDHKEKGEIRGNPNLTNVKRGSGPVANLRQLYRGITALKPSNGDSGENQPVISQSYRKLDDSFPPRPVYSSSAEELSEKTITMPEALPQSFSSPSLSERPKSPGSLKEPSPPPSPTPAPPSPEPGTPKSQVTGERIVYGENDMLYKSPPMDNGAEHLVYGVTTKASPSYESKRASKGRNHSSPTSDYFSKYGTVTSSYKKSLDRKSFSKSADSRSIAPSPVSRPSASSNSIQVFNQYLAPRSPTNHSDGVAKALNPGYNGHTNAMYRSNPQLYNSSYMTPARNTAAVTVTGNTQHPGYVAVARVDRDSGYSTHPYDYYSSLDRNMYTVNF